MRSGAAAGHEGCFHETVFYGSDDEFVSAIVPFLKEGVDAREPTLVSVGEKNSALIRKAMPNVSDLVFLPSAKHFTRPASTIRSCTQFVQGHLASGAHQVRMLGDVPHAGLGLPWAPWARYEAVANHAYSRFPLWKLCPYDTRLMSPQVRKDVECTHPRVATLEGGHNLNDRYLDPTEFFSGLSEADQDPLEQTTPLVDLWDPTAAAAREAVATLSGHSSVKPDALSNLITAVSEVVTNALVHGLPPVQLKAWAASDRLVVSVHDSGEGPTDPFAGLIPSESIVSGGLGLWIAHQLCNQVAYLRSGGGITVRLTAGGEFHAM